MTLNKNSIYLAFHIVAMALAKAKMAAAAARMVFSFLVALSHTN